MRVHKYRLGPLDNNTYIVLDEESGDAAIIDPSFDSVPLWQDIKNSGWTLAWVLNTHAHIDHVVENAFFVEKSGAPLALHPDDLTLLRGLPNQAAWMGMETPREMEPTHHLADGEVISIGNGKLRVACTPGHSAGSVSFIGDGFAIVGDALFAGSIGRTDLPGGNHDQLLGAIRARLLVLPDETIVYPGHGPETTIGHERLTNPFLI
jgi:hydroxyacylglutathione hydrolase